MRRAFIFLSLFFGLLYAESWTAAGEPDVLYTKNQSALVIHDTTQLGKVQLINRVDDKNTLIGGSIDGTPGCGVDILTARMCLKITPNKDQEIGEVEIGAEDTKTSLNTVKPDKVWVYETRDVIRKIPDYKTEDYTELVFDNKSGVDKLVAKTRQVFVGYVDEREPVLGWYPFKSGTTIEAGKSLLVGLDFTRKTQKDTVDLVPKILGVDFKQWAWWNTTWGYAIPVDINTTVSSNLTNFPAKVSINTSNSSLWNTATCTNLRILDNTNTSTYTYALDSSNSTFCGNATNNATFWVFGNWTGGVLNRVYFYLGNVGATSGENALAGWNSYGANAVYLMSDTTGVVSDSTNRYNLSTNATRGVVPPYSGFAGFVHNYGPLTASNTTSTLGRSNDNLTMIVTMNTPSVVAGGMIVGVNAYSDNEDGMLIRLGANSVVVEQNQGCVGEYVVGSTISANTTYRVAFVFSKTSPNNNMSLFVNGVFKNSTVRALGGTCDANVGLGIAKNIIANNNFYTGYADNVQIFDSVKSQDFLQADALNYPIIGATQADIPLNQITVFYPFNNSIFLYQSGSCYTIVEYNETTEGTYDLDTCQMYHKNTSGSYNLVETKSGASPLNFTNLTNSGFYRVNCTDIYTFSGVNQTSASNTIDFQILGSSFCRSSNTTEVVNKTLVKVYSPATLPYFDIDTIIFIILIGVAIFGLMHYSMILLKGKH